MDAPAPQSMSVRVSRSPVAGHAAALRAEDPMTIVIFGASGDLAKRKLIPALYHLQRGRLPARALRRDRLLAHADDATRPIASSMLEVLREQRRKGETVAADHPLVQALHYQAGDADKPGDVPGAEEQARGGREGARPARATGSSTCRSRRRSSRSSSRTSPPPG